MSGADPHALSSARDPGARPVALITGGTRGIGLGIARALAREGWHLALCGVRSADSVRDVLDDLRAIARDASGASGASGVRDARDAGRVGAGGAGRGGAGGASRASGGPGDGVAAEIVYEPADLAVTADRARLIEALRARFGVIHALVNNAGRAPRVRADLLQATEESFEEVLRTNLQGPYFLTQQVAAMMVAPQQAAPSPPADVPSDPAVDARTDAASDRDVPTRLAPAPGAALPTSTSTPARGAATVAASAASAGTAASDAGASTPRRGGIVFVTSVSADMASPNRGEYCVSKAGLAMTTKLFAVRLAEFGIPVYEVRPGIIATDMTAGVKEVYDRRIADGLIPDRRWGTPDDVGRAVAALLRGDVPYATGTVIHIDGGLSVPRL